MSSWQWFAGGRNAVVLIQAGGGFATGVMLMNTCATNIPYCLTAIHVVDMGGRHKLEISIFFL